MDNLYLRLDGPSSWPQHISPSPSHLSSSVPYLSTLFNGALLGRSIHSVSFKFLPSTHNLYSPLQKRMIQIVAVATSTFTIIAALITFCFFRRMEKRLRHKLIMLSILGCFIRGLWYMIFSITVLMGRVVTSKSAFCQASGWFIQIGNEMSDISTFLIAIHGALQIFRPRVTGSVDVDVGDGLHDYRYYCFAAITLIPIIDASIPFINSGPAYTAQGAFCSLPTSPIWYRLALSWIPRYMIGLSVIALSFAVYIHVEVKFRSYAASQRMSRTSIAVPVGNAAPSTGLGLLLQEHSVKVKIENSIDDRRRSSLPLLKMPDYDNPTLMEPVSKPTSPKAVKLNVGGVDQISAMDYFPPAWNPSIRKVSIATTASQNTDITQTSSKSHNSLPSIATLKKSHSMLHRSTSMNTPVTQTPQQRQDTERKALRRQLRLIFVYPIVYVVLWIPPCILSGLQFSPKYMANLPPQLGVLSTVCLTIMGGVDCIVFFWREKPWRPPQTHATSLATGDKDKDPEKGLPDEEREKKAKSVTSKSSLAKSIAALSPKGSKEQARTASSVAKTRAYERLALEVKDRREENSNDKVHECLESVLMPPPGADTMGTKGGKEWWDWEASSSS